MLKILLQLVATLAVVTLNGAAAEPGDEIGPLDAEMLLYGKWPTRQGVEQFLIDGLLKQAERAGTPIPGIDERAEQRTKLARHFAARLDAAMPRQPFELKLKFTPTGEIDLTQLSTRTLHADRAASAIRFVRDRFDAAWDATLAGDPFLHEALARIAKLTSLGANPPRPESHGRKPDPRLVEERAQRNAKAAFLATYGYDPTVKADRSLLAQIYLKFARGKIAQFRARIEARQRGGDAELAAERLFTRLYRVDLKTASLTDLAYHGEPRLRANHAAYHKLLAQERARAELEPRRAHDAPPHPTAPFRRLDLRAEYDRLERKILTHFYTGLPPEQWRIYQKVSPAAVDGRRQMNERVLTLVYDPTRADAGPPPVPNLTGTNGMYQPMDETGGPDRRLIPVYLPDATVRAQFDGPAAGLATAIYEHSVPRALYTIGESNGLSRTYNSLEDFVFQAGFLRVQAYATLMQVKENSMQGYPRTANETEAEQFRSRVFEYWFRAMFTERRNGAVLSGDGYLRLLALGLLEESPRALRDRDEAAARDRRPKLSLHAANEKQSRGTFAPLTQNLGGDDAPATSLSFEVRAQALDHQTGALTLKVQSHARGRVLLFVAKRLDDLRAATLEDPPAPRRRVTVEVVNGQPLLPNDLLPLLTPQRARLASLEVLSERDQIIPATAYDVLRSEWDGGYALRFRPGHAPAHARYRAVFRGDVRSSLPSPLIRADYAPDILTSLGEARATDVQRRLTEQGLRRQGLALDRVIDTFTAHSYYTKERAERATVTDVARPSTFGDLSTKDGVFVGNCEAGNVLMKSVLGPALRRQGLTLESRTVVAVEGTRYHEGEDLHAVLFVRDQAGRTAWYDATPRLGPLTDVAATASSTIQELIARSKNSVGEGLVPRLKAGVLRWWRGSRTKAPAVPAVQPMSTPAEIARAWTPTPSDARRDHARHEARAALARLDAHYVLALRDLERLGADRIADRTAPTWAIVRTTSLWLSFAHGRRDLPALVAGLGEITGVTLDRGTTRPDEYLRRVTEHLYKYLDLITREHARATSATARDLLLVTLHLAHDLQNTLAVNAFHDWPSLAGVLAATPAEATCEDELN